MKRAYLRARQVFVVLALGFLSLGPGEALELSGDFQSRFESNASNSDAPGEREADVFLGGGVRVGTGGILDRDWRWQAALVGQGEAATRFAELGFFETGPTLGLERKLGLGWQAPRIKIDALFTARAAGQPGASGLRFAPSLSVVLPLSERWGLDVHYRPAWFFTQSPVFASTGNEVGATAWFDLFPATRLSIGYDFRSGDVVSYAIPPRPDLVAVRIAQANSNAFGAERVVYRVAAATHRIEGRIAQTLTEHLDLHGTYRWETTHGPAGLNYQNHIVEIGLHARL